MILKRHFTWNKIDLKPYVKESYYQVVYTDDNGDSVSLGAPVLNQEFVLKLIDWLNTVNLDPDLDKS